jgi:hypothetical protein
MNSIGGGSGAPLAIEESPSKTLPQAVDYYQPRFAFSSFRKSPVIRIGVGPADGEFVEG